MAHVQSGVSTSLCIPPDRSLLHTFQHICFRRGKCLKLKAIVNQRTVQPEKCLELLKKMFQLAHGILLITVTTFDINTYLSFLGNNVSPLTISKLAKIPGLYFFSPVPLTLWAICAYLINFESTFKVFHLILIF